MDGLREAAEILSINLVLKHRMLVNLFPISYITLCLGFLLGIGLTSVLIGFVSSTLILLLILLGVIRIMPIVNLCNSILSMFLPNQVRLLESNIKESFKITGSLRNDRYIYMWHPHSGFATTMFFHGSSSSTEWPSHLRNLRTVAFSMVQWFPFMQELFEQYKIIPSDYHIMKKTLEQGYSISLAPGGMREMLYEDTTLMSRRRGIFKIALETGTSLVPIVSVNEMYLWKMMDLPDFIQGPLESYDLCIPVPSLKSVYKFLGLLNSPLNDPIISVIGEPIQVEKVLNPTEQQIIELRAKYLEQLQVLYKKETGRDLSIK